MRPDFDPGDNGDVPTAYPPDLSDRVARSLAELGEVALVTALAVVARFLDGWEPSVEGDGPSAWQRQAVSEQMTSHELEVLYASALIPRPDHRF